MAIDWTAEVLDQIESHWQHRLRPRLAGLSDEEYFWQPAPDCWTVSPTTIAWRLGHLAEGLASMNGTHFGGPTTSVETYDYAGTGEQALRQLDDAYGAWVSGVRALGDAGLARPQGAASPPEFADAPVARLVLYTSVENFHHGAEVCLLRDLFLRRRRAAPRT
jgi:hypothetical protein